MTSSNPSTANKSEIDTDAVRKRWNNAVYTEGFKGTEAADRAEALAMCDLIDAYVKTTADLAMRLEMAKRTHQDWLDSPAGSLAAQNMELRRELRELREQVAS
jgi:hypothetical protein